MASPSPSSRRFFPRPRLQWPLFLLIAVLLLRTARATARTGVDVPFETLLVDNSVPILVNGKWEWVAEDAPELRKRQDDDDDDDDDDDRRATPTPSPTKTKDDDEEAGSTVTVRPKTTDENGEEHLESITSTTSTTTKAPLPSAFDNSLDFNFTSNGGKSCPKFLNNLLTSDTFKSCYPISMMLQTSKSFFDATKELQSIVTVLDATCAADLDYCTTYLSDQADSLTSDSNCGQEFSDQQPDIRRVHLGLTSYNVLYKATCLRRDALRGDERDGGSDDAYCFADAVTNTSTPANAYVYFLPLNMTLPGSATPACGGCLRDTMAIYQAATATRSLAIADRYEGAAGRVNEVCGEGFANETLPEAVGAGARVGMAPGVVVTAAVVVLLNSVL